MTVKTDSQVHQTMNSQRSVGYFSRLLWFDGTNEHKCSKAYANRDFHQPINLTRTG